MNKEYDYEVSKQGYETREGIINLQKDSTLSVLLSEGTGIESGGLKELSFYPNPVDETLSLTAYFQHQDVFNQMVIP